MNGQTRAPPFHRGENATRKAMPNQSIRLYIFSVIFAQPARYRHEPGPGAGVDTQAGGPF